MRIRSFVRALLKRVPVLKRRSEQNDSSPSIPHGLEGIEQVGHRKYVGGKWEEIGRLQFKFLVEEGLRPHHYLLDVGCGSLRAGILLVPYLKKGHYLGIDKEEELLQAGIEELGKLYEVKEPQLVASADFAFERFDARPDYAIAQSLFTHLPVPLVRECFEKLRKVMDAGNVFYATFFESEQPKENADAPHDHRNFFYTRGQMEQFGWESGWEPTYIGDWNHPRGQMMMKYTAA